MTRPDIKFSEDSGAETKQALEKYRDKKELGSIEDAVRELLPAWAFHDDPQTVILGKPAGFRSRMVSITPESVTFENGEKIVLPPGDDWDTIRLQVTGIEPALSDFVDNYLDDSMGEPDQWEPVRCEMSTLGKPVERVRIWKSTPTAATVNEIHIPRSRVEAQLELLNEAVEKRLSDNVADDIVELTRRLHNLNSAVFSNPDDDDVRAKRDKVESDIMDIAPDWLTQAREVETELAWLARILKANNHGHNTVVQYE